MTDGVLHLTPGKAFDFCYLHGNAPGGSASRGKNNLHLAVRPKAGASSSVQSTYGPLFMIQDAEAIPIQQPIEALSDWTGYGRCQNFRFGMQIYDVPLEAAGPGGSNEAVRRLREGVLSLRSKEVGASLR